MSGNNSTLSKKEREQIVEWRTKNFTPKEIALKLAKSDDFPGTTTESTIEDYLSREDVQEEMQVRKDIKEKEAEYSQEELIRDLKNLKEEMWR